MAALKIQRLPLWLTISALGVASPVNAQESSITFATTEGTWVSLDVTPDGGSLVLELLGDVYSLPVRGGEARPLLVGRAFQSQPRFSQDGARLVYVSDESGSDNVWVARADGTGARQLSNVEGATVLSPAWSADATAVFATVISTGPSGSAAEIWRYDVETGEGSRLVENTNGRSQPLVSAPAPGAYGAVAAPDGSGLYYTSVTPRPYGSRSGASSAVHFVNLESGADHRVPLEGLNAMKPVVSPDGRQLVYAAMKDGRTGLKVRHLGAGAERWLAYPIQRHQLESRATRDVLPNLAIAPDSRSVFLEWNGRIHRIALEDGHDQLIPFSVDVSLSVEPRLDFPRRVETGPVEARAAQQLAGAADGRLAFSALARVWVTDENGDNATRLTRTERAREFMPAWSPDGRWVAFVTWDETGGHLWKARADASAAPVRLTEQPALWADPVWTPSGVEIAAVTAPLGSTRGGPAPGQGVIPREAAVVVVSADGGAHRVLAAAEGLRHPHFGPDPDRVYLSSASAGLVSVGLDGANRREEARAAADLGRAELRMSPDGSHVLASGRAGLTVFPVPSEGLSGAVLAADRGVSLSPVAPATVAWSAGGSRVSWLAGMQLTEVDVAAPSDSRRERQLSARLPRSAPSGSVVLRGGKVITMNGYEIVEDADVVVQANRIAAVGRQGTVQIPQGATVIDVSGTVITPGFVDVHAHFGANAELLQPESTTAFANLAYGITTVRNPQSSPDIFTLADVIEADGVPSPRVYSTGPGLFNRTSFRSLEDARRVVQRYRGEYGTHLLKWYLGGDRQQRGWLVEAAREFEMMPTTEGGADTKANLTYALDGFSGLEHAFPVAPIHDDFVQVAARTGITYTPTLLVSFGAALPIYRLLAEERPHENPKLSRWFADGELFGRSSSRILWFPPEDYNAKDVGEGASEILEAGGRVALGGHGEVQGLSAHWEMQLLARGGMSRHDILRVATIHGAEAIGFGQDLGSLETGKLADLVVLDANPLESIEATQSIRYVMKNGVLYQGESLDEVWPGRERLVMPWALERQDGPGGALTAIEDLVRSTLTDAQVPGIAVAVVRQGEVVMSKGFGVADIETDGPVSSQTMFQSGSVGKQFTSAGIMALVEDGRIDLNSSVRDYIAEAPESWQPITIRHLLTHSSGIPDYTSNEFDYQTNYTEEDLVRMASGLDLEFPPGARWNYSNTGYVILGVVMSRVTGVPYWDFLQDRIFGPAGMPTIRINTQKDIVPHRAQGYLPVDGGWRHPDYIAPMTNTTADGSMLISLEDMLAWSDVVANRTLISPESWDLILSPMTLNSGRNYPYGFGWFLEEAGGQLVQQHGGSWQGFITQITRFTEDDMTVIVLMNSRNFAGPGLAMGIGAILNPDLAPPPPPVTPIEDPDPVATAYVRDMLAKISRGELVLSDFAFVRQTVFPRMKVALEGQLEGMGSPDRMALLSDERVGDDRALQYWAWYGDRRFRVRVSLGPEGGLTALRVLPGPS